MESQNDPTADAFIGLRARYEALMDMEIGAELIAVAVWVDALEAILTDAKLAGINPMEVTHR